MSSHEKTSPRKPEITVYEKTTCSTCRSLVQLLQSRGIPFERVQYMIDPIPRDKLRQLVDAMGMRPRDIVRTREPIWKELGRDLDTMSDDEVLDLLAEHPSLVQRPIVERGGRAVLARPVERVESLL